MKVYIVLSENSETMFVSREDAEKYAEFYNLEEYFIEEVEVFSWEQYRKLFIVR